MLPLISHPSCPFCCPNSSSTIFNCIFEYDEKLHPALWINVSMQQCVHLLPDLWRRWCTSQCSTVFVRWTGNVNTFYLFDILILSVVNLYLSHLEFSLATACSKWISEREKHATMYSEPAAAFSQKKFSCLHDYSIMEQGSRINFIGFQCFSDGRITLRLQQRIKSVPSVIRT